jgi:hypothetical protein
VKLSVRVFWVAAAALGMQLMEFKPTLKHALGLWIYGLSTAAALGVSDVWRDIRTAFLKFRLWSPRP